MSRLQAFVVMFIVLAIQTCFLIASGYNLGKDYAFPTFLLFAIVDFVLCALAYTLKVIEEK